MNRTALIILAICVVAILAGAYLLLYTTAKAPVEEQGTNLTAGPVPFTVLATGTGATNAPARKNYRIVSDTELASVWTAVYGKDTPPPAVDFSKHEVLAVLDGPHPTGGYSVKVTSVVNEGSGRAVVITHAAPDSSCVVTQAKTSPFEFVLVPKMEGEMLSHIDDVAMVACK